jgi:septum formation protein
MRIVLASASPRRAELLRAAGYRFDTLIADFDERLRAGETPEQYVRRLATGKSGSALEMLVQTAGEVGDVLVLAADTAVVVNGTILGKPQNDREAASMLERLSGRTHRVLTGVSVRSQARESSRVEATAVEFKPLSREDIDWYVASGEGRDKAGSYAIQGLASRFIPRIDGSYSNVVGLPVATVHELVAEIASYPSSGLS